jgi:tetratricopeptide (TPR) repeat protein
MRWASAGFPALLVVLVCVCFLPILSNEFVNWDDDLNLTDNPEYRGLSWSHVRWMFTTLHGGHYQPLSWLTLGMDYTLWGMDPTGYHLSNLLLHATTAVASYALIMAILRRILPTVASADPIAFRGAALAGALFFAIHPLRVESVAWASERRDVLSGLFFTLTLLTYLRMQGERGRTRRKWFLLSGTCCALSVLSKAWGVTLPVILLALDVYPLRRFTAGGGTRRSALLEKVPYAALAFGAAVMAIRAQRVEAMHTLAQHGPIERTMQAAYGLCFYLRKTVVPLQLSPLYLLEQPLNPGEPRYVSSLLVVLAISAGVVVFRHRWPWALLAWVCYVVVLSPVLGFVQSGIQIAADRYTYLACFPYAVVVAAGLYRLWNGDAARRLVPLARRVGTTATGGALVVLGALTFQQTQVWKDSYTLWNHALGIDATDYIAYTNRGFARQALGELDEAFADYTTALRFNPGHPEAYNNRGIVRFATGDVHGAIEDYTAAIRFKPRYADAHTNRAIAREAQADSEGAMADYTAAIRFNPRHAKAYYGRGNLWVATGDLDAAIADYTQATRIDPGYAEAYSNRAFVRRAKGDSEGAIADYTRALQAAPPEWSGREMVQRNLVAVRGTPAEGTGSP